MPVLMMVILVRQYRRYMMSSGVFHDNVYWIMIQCGTVVVKRGADDDNVHEHLLHHRIMDYDQMSYRNSKL